MGSPLRLLAALVALTGAGASCVATGAAVMVSAGPGAGPVSSPGASAPAVPSDASGAALAARDASGAALAALSWALARVGTPYRWGGVGPDGFDCSGLAQAAYRAAGIALARVAQQQYDAGPPVDAASPVLAGDLVFFGSSPAAVDHVGIALGQGDMVDAPHSGAVVRVEPVWSDGYLGATRPAG